MPKKIHDHIRDAARKRVKVNITARTRSDCGFTVEFMEDSGCGMRLCTKTVPTKTEALSLLLIKTRCAPQMHFGIKPAKLSAIRAADKQADDKQWMDLAQKG